MRRVGSDGDDNLKPFLCAVTACVRAASKTRLDKAKGIDSKRSLPASILEKSRMSLTMANSTSADNGRPQIMPLLGIKLCIECQYGHAKVMPFIGVRIS